MAERGEQKVGSVEEEESVGEGRQDDGRRKSEEEVYTLLFREVDSDGKGVVSVSSLVEYLHQIQLGPSERGDRGAGLEEVYDSHEDVG